VVHVIELLDEAIRAADQSPGASRNGYRPTAVGRTGAAETDTGATK
jgi:hypothetical protein